MVASTGLSISGMSCMKRGSWPEVRTEKRSIEMRVVSSTMKWKSSSPNSFQRMPRSRSSARSMRTRSAASVKAIRPWGSSTVISRLGSSQEMSTDAERAVAAGWRTWAV
jgi:hypothetical protein